MALSRKLLIFAETEAEKYGFKTTTKDSKDRIHFTLEKDGKRGTFSLPANKKVNEGDMVTRIKVQIKNIKNQQVA